MPGIPHRYLTETIPGIHGRIKEAVEDFCVEEVPLYSPCGEGEHVYFEIEKRDLSTLEGLERLSEALGRDFRDFGFAGLKDRKGITRQVLSISGVSPERVLELGLPQLTVLWARRHRNKLRVGHLKGNRFFVRIRGVHAACRDTAAAFLTVIRERGLPNYYGYQRFGIRGDAQWVGRAFLVNDDEAAVRRILGKPSAVERNPEIVAARYLFLQYRWAEALQRFPRAYREERKLLRFLLRRGEDFRRARHQIRSDIVKLYFTAYQSYLFNRALEARLRISGGNLDRFYDGDVAYIHERGASFRVDDPVGLVERASSFEISPSGPIFGRKMLVPAAGPEEAIERRLLERQKLSLEDFDPLERRYGLGGGRRPFRVRAEDIEWQLVGDSLELRFFLPKGAYATSLLREVMKNERVPPGFYEAVNGQPG